MVKITGFPVHTSPPFEKEGVTVMVAVTGDVPAQTAVNELMFPVPLAPNPMEVFELVQLYTVPLTVPVKLIAADGDSLHRFWLFTGFTVGVGFTVML